MGLRDGGGEVGGLVGLSAGVDAGCAMGWKMLSRSFQENFWVVSRPASSVAMAFPTGWLAEVTTQTKP